ncbi:MAG: ABC transporter ATP-binding protein [Holosporales bacterium]|jgi:putrescine transport system ATP-binding protein|nr:ABC transporter ATP-binding protein [Holosporales bacterium]
MVLAGYPVERKSEAWQDVNAEPYIYIENVTKSFGEITPVKNISLSIYKGELFALLGQSGCGKTTLLRMLAGFEQTSQGRILIDGVDVTNMPVHKRPVNIMFQSYALFPHLNVFDNIAFGLKRDGLSKKVIRDTVKEALSIIQLTGLEDRMVNQLSGGQRQRVALARSFVKRPKLLLLDEPLAALDKKLREQTQFELVNILERVEITSILVTHDQEEAMTMATRIAVMEDGKIKQVGAPHDVYEFPNSKFVAEFVGNINIFNGIVVEQELDHVLIESPEISCYCYASHSGAIPIGSSVSFAVRPEKVVISMLQPAYPRNWAKGTIKEIAYLGDISVYYVQLPSGKIIIATLPNLLRLTDRSFQWEDVVYLYWRSENSLVLTT